MDMQAAIRNFVFMVLGLFLFKITIGDSLLHDQKDPHFDGPATSIEVSE